MHMLYLHSYLIFRLAYIDITYFEQAQEHLLNAFKLNENVSQDLNMSSKEYQIKILINLAK